MNTLRPEDFYPALQRTIRSLAGEAVAPERQAALQQLQSYIRSRLSAGQAARLVFICTHNSRRSHLAQVWGQALAAWFGLPGVVCYSGGTEATALYPQTARALEAAGFRVAAPPSGNNPAYRFYYGPAAPAVRAFSKVFQHPGNPRQDFAAIITCTAAEAACPVVPGADLRLALPYEDPGRHDHSPGAEQAYQARSRQIAAELYFVFSGLG